MRASTLTGTPQMIADLAVRALHDEADLTPKPGLVDGRGPGAHADMTGDMLHASADALRDALAECACAATESPVGPELRARLGVIGRAGERAMLAATGGVNTHRGALWALGLLSAAAAATDPTTGAVVDVAARLARIPDPAADSGTSLSHGARVRVQYGAPGAAGEARRGFPHVTRYALPAVREGRPLDGLLAVIAHLDDTCLLHRGGPAGLAAVQHGARRTLRAGGMRTHQGRQRFDELDALCADRRLSPGGAGDLLAAAMFLDGLERRRSAKCRP